MQGSTSSISQINIPLFNLTAQQVNQPGFPVLILGPNLKGEPLRMGEQMDAGGGAVAVDALKPYVKRAMEDPELRDDLVAAFVAARSLYGQISKGEGVRGKAEKISEKDFQKQLQSLVSDVTEASDRLKGEKESHKTRNRVILLTGVTLGVLYNPWTGEQTREWIMDRIAGGDDALEEFVDETEADSSAGGNGSEP